MPATALPVPDRVPLKHRVLAAGAWSLAGYAVSGFLFSRGWLGVVAAIAGALVGAIWNYTMSRLVTWKQ